VKAESLVFWITSRLCVHPQGVTKSDLESWVRVQKGYKISPKNEEKGKILVLQFAELDILSRELVASHTPIVSLTWRCEI
jgi:hypothetical protein